MTIDVETSIGKFEVVKGQHPYRVKIVYLESYENLEKINSFIKDLGKFETLTKGITALTNYIGISEVKDIELIHCDFKSIGDFRNNPSRDRYELIIDSIEQRTESKRKEITEENIREMIKNIDKYHSLGKSFEIWNEIKNPPNAPH